MTIFFEVAVLVMIAVALIAFIVMVIIGKMVHDNQIKLKIKNGKIFCNPL